MYRVVYSCIWLYSTVLLCIGLYIHVYYMDSGILLGTKTLVEFVLVERL